MPILINREDVVTFILGNLSPIFWNASVLRIFVPGFEEDRPKDSENDLEWRVHEVCGAMFGEERVNNLVDLLSRVLIAFSVGQISALVTVTHFYCNLLLQMLECYWSCSHARLACFLFETNQHFVGSARIAGLCLTDEVELEQSCQEGRLVWSVKIRRVRFTRCVFRYGPRDGMTWEQERTSRHFKLAGQERWRRLGGRFASTVL